MLTATKHLLVEAKRGSDRRRSGINLVGRARV